MKTITNKTIGLTPDEIRDELLLGQLAATDRSRRRELMAMSRLETKRVRAKYGFVERDAPLLTAPGDQHKLGLAKRPSYGLTLFHASFRATDGSTWNLCPSAGDCRRVCVIGNGNGRYDGVQDGWRWRTELLATRPRAFFRKLGYETQMAVMKHVGKCVHCGVEHTLKGHRHLDHILLRPNVNSDVEWHKLAPALVDGSVFGADVMFYGYTKHPEILETDGWLAPKYRTAYSWNEKSPPWGDALAFLGRGGSVAVVTDRYYTPRTRETVKRWSVFCDVVDGDVSDEWIFQRGVIGDLAFKPATSALRRWGQDSDFVVKAYGSGGRMQTFDEVSVTIERKAS